ncbi:hypothetical protein ABZS29_28990 [Kribbella sp. NPDC005582]|uniref:hypothetical protein n=1 Tax=Kribbella sp. NPDC005582 TaxID=3156893 RepID=UPI0033B5063D
MDPLIEANTPNMMHYVNQIRMHSEGQSQQGRLASNQGTDLLFSLGGDVGNVEYNVNESWVGRHNRAAVIAGGHADGGQQANNHLETLSENGMSALGRHLIA